MGCVVSVQEMIFRCVPRCARSSWARCFSVSVLWVKGISEVMAVSAQAISVMINSPGVRSSSQPPLRPRCSRGLLSQSSSSMVLMSRARMALCMWCSSFSATLMTVLRDTPGGRRMRMSSVLSDSCRQSERRSVVAQDEQLLLRMMSVVLVVSWWFRVTRMVIFSGCAFSSGSRMSKLRMVGVVSALFLSALRAVLRALSRAQWLSDEIAVMDIHLSINENRSHVNFRRSMLFDTRY